MTSDVRRVRIPEPAWRSLRSAAALSGLTIGQYIVAAHAALSLPKES